MNLVLGWVGLQQVDRVNGLVELQEQRAKVLLASLIWLLSADSDLRVADALGRLGLPPDRNCAAPPHK